MSVPFISLKHVADVAVYVDHMYDKYARGNFLLEGYNLIPY